MTARYQIQARLLERQGSMIVRDEVRLDASEHHDCAMRTAQSLVGDGFTVWIFIVEPAAGSQPSYQLVDTLRPGRRAAPPSVTPATPEPRGSSPPSSTPTISTSAWATPT